MVSQAALSHQNSCRGAFVWMFRAAGVIGLGRRRDPCLYAGGMRSITRIMATVLPVFTSASGIPFTHDHTSPVFATNCLPGLG
jgi:hypothetical protein